MAFRDNRPVMALSSGRIYNSGSTASGLLQWCANPNDRQDVTVTERLVNGDGDGRIPSSARTDLPDPAPLYRQRTPGGRAAAAAERALSERFATTRITIKEALSSLEADGLIYRAERRGWFVAPPRLTYDPAITPTFTSGLVSSSAPPRPGCWPMATSLPAASCAAGWVWNPLRRCMKSPPAADRRSPRAPRQPSPAGGRFPTSPALLWPAPSPSFTSSAMAA